MIAHPNAGRGRRAVAPESPADLLRRAAANVDARWAATFGPEIESVLSAWLQAEADCWDATRDVSEHLPRVMDAIAEQATEAAQARHGVHVSISTTEQALAVARVILGETT